MFSSSLVSPPQAAQEEPQLCLPGRLGQGLPTGRRFPDGQGQPQVLQLPGLQKRLRRRRQRQRQRSSPPGGPGAPEAGAAAARAGGQGEAEAGGQLLKPEGAGLPEGSVSP